MWSDVEQGVVAALAGLQRAGEPLLVVVRGRGVMDRRRLAAELGRELAPAAYVVMEGREPGEKNPRSPGAVTLTVWLAARSLRSEADARLGEADGAGVHELAARSAEALQGLEVAGARLGLIEETSRGVDERLALWEQRYEVRRMPAMTAPTFDGVALCGAASRVSIEVGAARRALATFSFPGVDGAFAWDLGTREREIVWRGELEAADDAAMNAVEAEIEARLGFEGTVVDGWGRTFEMCVLKVFERKGPRRRDELSGAVVQGFELAFVQVG